MLKIKKLLKNIFLCQELLLPLYYRNLKTNKMKAKKLTKEQIEKKQQKLEKEFAKALKKTKEEWKKATAGMTREEIYAYNRLQAGITEEEWNKIRKNPTTEILNIRNKIK